MAYGNLKVDVLETSSGVVQLTNIVSTNATTSAAGYMSAADKTKLDGLGGSGGAFAETGVWTPKMQHVYFSGTYQLADMYSHTYGSQVGKYVRVGKLVTVSFTLFQPGTIVYATGNGQSSNFPDFLGNLPYPVQAGWKTQASINDYSGFTGLGEFTSYGQTYGPYTPVFTSHSTLSCFELKRLAAGSASTVSTASQSGFGLASAYIAGSITYMTSDTTETPGNGATAD
jgi:hypothetical protein